jgi:hypothetical protein
VRTFENAKEAEDWDANFPDENTQYYLKRLEEYSSKFEPFFSEKDFRAIFSSSEDLFGFDPNQIRILPPQRAVPEQRDEDLPSQGSSISLDI